MTGFKGLMQILPKNSGRNATGVITTRHQGGRQKRFYRQIDWTRDKRDIIAKIVSIEYDPNRTSNIALVQYADGEKRYILAPEGIMLGQKVMSGEQAPLTAGNALPLKAIPVGTLIHNLELMPGRGAKLVRGAGGAAVVQGFEEKWALVKLPSGEIRRFSPAAYAVIGQVGNIDWKKSRNGKRWTDATNGRQAHSAGHGSKPRSHPHGGGEGRSGEGMPPKTPWGKSARGNRTRKNLST